MSQPQDHADEESDEWKASQEGSDSSVGQGKPQDGQSATGARFTAEPRVDDDPSIEDHLTLVGDATSDDDFAFEDPLSLDDLGAAYARVAAQENPDSAALAETDLANEGTVKGESVDDLETDETGDASETLVTPETIVEAALFVGHPENKALSEQRLASLMRGVSPDEIVEVVERLNEVYRAEDQALRIIRDDSGFRMTIAPAVEHMRRSFLGKVREARLSQMAIEVLSLVAYQPGITATKVQDQRGRDSGSLLNQLVRRQLLRMERIKPEGAKRPVPHYYPTERFLHLFSLESLDELPQVEEGFRE